MMTQEGRVVYDRKKNVIRPSDIARIMDSYSDGLNGREFGEFVHNILDITLERQPRKTGWKLGFWLMLINLAGLPADPEIREQSEEKIEAADKKLKEMNKLITSYVFKLFKKIYPENPDDYLEKGIGDIHLGPGQV